MITGYVSRVQYSDEHDVCLIFTKLSEHFTHGCGSFFSGAVAVLCMYSWFYG